jgi:hypothetical protein
MVAGQSLLKRRTDRNQRKVVNSAIPSSAVIKTALLIINVLRFKSAVFLHYILHKLTTLGEFQSEMDE